MKQKLQLGVPLASSEKMDYFVIKDLDKTEKNAASFWFCQQITACLWEAFEATFAVFLVGVPISKTY